jgi:hypothetical protein
MSTKAQSILRDVPKMYGIGLCQFGMFTFLSRSIGFQTDDETELIEKNPNHNKFLYDVHRTLGWPHYILKMAIKVYKQ